MRGLHVVKTVAPVLLLGWIATANATPLTLSCSSLQGSIIFAEPFQATSGGCSTGTFTGTLNNPIEGIITARVTHNGSSLIHQHDIVDIGSGTNWLVSTEAIFGFTVTPEMASVTLQASSSPSLEETFLQIQGPSGTFGFLGGGWQSSGSPPAGTLLLGGNKLELLPGAYHGFYRFKTFTSSGHKVQSVSLAIDAATLPIPEPSTARLLLLGLLGATSPRPRRWLRRRYAPT